MRHLAKLLVWLCRNHIHPVGCKGHVLSLTVVTAPHVGAAMHFGRHLQAQGLADLLFYICVQGWYYHFGK